MLEEAPTAVVMRHHKAYRSSGGEATAVRATFERMERWLSDNGYRRITGDHRKI
jgi:hypothetical protein